MTEIPTPPSDREPPPAIARFSIAATAAGAAGAALLPGHPLGLNVALTFGAIAVAVVSARPRHASLDGILLGLAATALAGAAAIRDATWVVVVDLMAACGLAVLAVTGISTWTRVVRDGLFAALRVLDGFAYVLRPVLDRTHGIRWRGLGPVARGAVMGIMLVTVFGTLFVTADRAFAQLVGDVVAVDWDLGLMPARIVIALLIVAATGALALSGPLIGRERFPLLLRAVGADAAAAEFAATRFVGRKVWKRERWEWAIPIFLLDVLFAAFVAVQLTVLFGGQRHVLETAGLTYAEYARSGFFQLCAVGVGALAVVAATTFFATRATKQDDVILRVLLGALMALTAVVLVSALKRLDLYEAAYGYTRLRLAVHATILWMGGIIVLVSFAGIRLQGGWLPAAAVAFTATALLGFTALNPDGLIARQNIERFERSGTLDVAFVSSLGADAVGELNKLPPGLRECALNDVARRLKEESWVSFNLARHRARSLVGDGEWRCEGYLGGHVR